MKVTKLRIGNLIFQSGQITTIEIMLKENLWQEKQ